MNIRQLLSRLQKELRSSGHVIRFVSLTVAGVLWLSLVLGLTGYPNLRSLLEGVIHLQPGAAGPTSTPVAPGSTSTPVSLPPVANMTFTYPRQMVVEASDTVSVEIVGNPKQLDTGIVSIESRLSSGERSVVTDTIHLYPVMTAQLLGPNFKIDPPATNSLPQDLMKIGNAAWTWNVVPSIPGEQEIMLQIHGQNTGPADIPPVLVKSISRNITVADKSLSTLLRGQIFTGSNLVTLLGTGGPLALIAGWMITYRQSRKTNRTLQEKVEALEARIMELEAKKGRRTKGAAEPEETTQTTTGTGQSPAPPARPWWKFWQRLPRIVVVIKW